MSELEYKYVFVLAMNVFVKKIDDYFARIQVIWLSDNRIIEVIVMSSNWNEVPVFSLTEEKIKEGFVKEALKEQFEENFNSLSLSSKKRIISKWKDHFDALDLPLTIKNQIELISKEKILSADSVHPLEEGVVLSCPGEGEDEQRFIIEQDKIAEIYLEHGMSPLPFLQKFGPLILNEKDIFSNMLNERILSDLINDVTCYLVKTSALVSGSLRKKLDEVIEIEKLIALSEKFNKKEKTFN